MKNGLLKSVLFLSMVSAGAAVLGRAIIGTFVYDIFDKCVNPSQSDAGSYMCRNASDLVQVFSIVLAAIIFFAVVFVLIRDKKNLRKSLINSGILSVLYLILLIANWQLLANLQGNFTEFYRLRRGIPVSFTEYLLTLYSRLGDIPVGILLGFMVWVPQAFNRRAIDADKRKEPRLKFALPKKKK